DVERCARAGGVVPALRPRDAPAREHRPAALSDPPCGERRADGGAPRHRRAMTAVVVGIAVFFLAMGAYALAVPARVLPVFGVTVTTVDGRNEVRAVYGGFGIAIGVLLLVTLGEPTLRAGVLVSVGTALAGMAGGRLVAALVEGSPGFYPWF